MGDFGGTFTWSPNHDISHVEVGLARITNDLIIKYNMGGRIVNDLIVKYNIHVRVTNNLIVKYNMVGRIVNDLIIKYNMGDVVEELTRVVNSIIIKYNVESAFVQVLVSVKQMADSFRFRTKSTKKPSTTFNKWFG